MLNMRYEKLNPLTLFCFLFQPQSVQAYWRGVGYSEPKYKDQPVRSGIYVKGPCGVYEDDSGNLTAYQLPPFGTEENPNLFGKSNTYEKTDNTCTGSNIVTISYWNDTEFCNSVDPTDVNGFYDTTSYLFPSLWSKWKITTTFTQAYQLEYEQLALAVVFQYVSSPNQSEGDPASCFTSDACSGSVGNPDNPLVGQQWCTASTCGECQTNFNNSNFFFSTIAVMLKPILYLFRTTNG